MRYMSVRVLAGRDGLLSKGTVYKDVGGMKDQQGIFAEG